MVRGRRVGSTKVTASQIQKMKEMTEKGCFRSEIMEELKLSKNTIYRYQKKYGML